MKDVQHIKIPQDDDGQRLDRWLKKNVEEMSFVMAQKLIRTGQIRIDGKRVKPDTRLVAGQEIRLPPMDARPEKTDGYRLRDDDAEMIRHQQTPRHRLARRYEHRATHRRHARSAHYR